MRRLLLTVALVGLAVLVVVAVGPLRQTLVHALHGEVHALRAELRGLGMVGAVVLVGLILTHAVVFFPAEIPNATAGLVFGFAVALPLVVVARLASGLLAYWLGAVVDPAAGAARASRTSVNTLRYAGNRTGTHVSDVGTLHAG